MINFFHTLCVCILALFGWYQPIESAAQQPIDALNKNAYVYTDRLIMSVADFFDYYRFYNFLSYYRELLGSETISTRQINTPINVFNSYYLDNTQPSDLYVTTSYAFDNMSSTDPSSNVAIKNIIISSSVQPPTMNRMGYYLYSIDFYDFDGNSLIHLPFMIYITTPPTVSGTLLDNPTYYWTLDFDGLSYNHNRINNLWSIGIVIKQSNSDFFNAWRWKGLPIDESDEWQTGYESGYGFGYTDGYDEGLDIGNTQGYQTGYTDGNTQGYQTGYASGLLDGQSYDQTALTIFTGIIEVGLLPVNIFLQMFNYEIFGINISGVVSALLTISIVIIIIRFLLGKKDD